MMTPKISNVCFVIGLVFLTGCATATPSDGVYKQRLAEIEAAYTRGEISREEYEDSKRELETADGTKAETWLDLWWGGAE